MFLSKKNAIYFNKPKNQDPNKPKRILGGTSNLISRLAGRLIIKRHQHRLQKERVNQTQTHQPKPSRRRRYPRPRHQPQLPLKNRQEPNQGSILP